MLVLQADCQVNEWIARYFFRLKRFWNPCLRRLTAEVRKITLIVKRALLAKSGIVEDQLIRLHIRLSGFQSLSRVKWVPSLNKNHVYDS